MKPDESPRRPVFGRVAPREDEASASPAEVRKKTRPEPTPVQRAIGLLTRREHSRKELTRKLVARGVESGDASAAVERLAGDGWQDDERFAEMLLRSRVSQGYGPIHIRAELGMHGLDRDAIAAAFGEFDGDWVECARNLVTRRFGGELARDMVRQRKAAQMLVRRGFDTAQIRAAIHCDPEGAEP